jgi:hypothetical protein
MHESHHSFHQLYFRPRPNTKSFPFLEPERFSEVSQDGYINFSGAPVRMVKSTKKFSRERLTGMSFLAPHTYMFRKLGELGKGSFGVVEKVNFY